MQNISLPFPKELIRNTERITEAEKDWSELSLFEQKYVLYLVNEARNGKVFTGTNSNLLYSLGITQTITSKYSERLPGGNSPDVDWDFEDREVVIDYIHERYGKDYVARVGRFGFLRSKGAIKDVCRVLDKPFEFADELSGLVPPPLAGLWESFESEAEQEPKLLDKKYKDIIDPVRKLWGIVRSYGTHAGGIVISPVPISTLVPLWTDKDNNLVTQFDFRDLEQTGLLKYDILGVITLKVVRLALKYIKERGVNLDLESIEDGDKDSYNLICSGDLDGVFQLGLSARSLTVSFAPKSIDELSLISALNRPGPMQSGMVDVVIARRQGKVPTQYSHPKLEPILEESYGLCVYQEQIMKVATDLAGYTLPEADSLRKVIGKKLVSGMEDQGKKLIAGMTKNGISLHTAEEIYKTIEGSAKYSFNKCLVGDTQICLSPIEDKNFISIDEISDKLSKREPVTLLSYDPSSEKTISDNCIEVVDCGIQEVYEARFIYNSKALYTKVICTKEHQFLCEDNIKRSLQEIYDLRLNVRTGRWNPSCLFYIESIKSIGKYATYNLTMENEPHNFVLANGIVSGNSHSVSYSYLTYITAWLKAHYPTEFYAALLACEKKPENVTRYVSSARDRGIQILPPDINISDIYHRPEGNNIRFGLSHIRGLGEKTAKAIIEARNVQKN